VVSVVVWVLGHTRAISLIVSVPVFLSSTIYSIWSSILTSVLDTGIEVSEKLRSVSFK
jgi:hypothetical protein